jgi:hypothetical protein
MLFCEPFRLNLEFHGNSSVSRPASFSLPQQHNHLKLWIDVAQTTGRAHLGMVFANKAVRSLVTAEETSVCHFGEKGEMDSFVSFW